jgi:hypothetical protein
MFRDSWREPDPEANAFDDALLLCGFLLLALAAITPRPLVLCARNKSLLALSLACACILLLLFELLLLSNGSRVADEEEGVTGSRRVAAAGRHEADAGPLALVSKLADALAAAVDLAAAVCGALVDARDACALFTASAVLVAEPVGAPQPESFLCFS